MDPIKTGNFQFGKGSRFWENLFNFGLKTGASYVDWICYCEYEVPCGGKQLQEAFRERALASVDWPPGLGGDPTILPGVSPGYNDPRYDVQPSVRPVGGYDYDAAKPGMMVVKQLQQDKINAAIRRDLLKQAYKFAIRCANTCGK